MDTLLSSAFAFHTFFLAQIYLILTSKEPYMRQAEHTDMESETGWGGDINGIVICSVN